jgi:folate-binding protein YgfZ
MSAVAYRTTRDRVRATGPDALSFLHGQLSQDLTSLAVGDATWSLLLQPSGKVDAWLRVHRRTDDELALDVDAGYGEAVLARLSRFLLRTKCELTAEPDVPCVAVRGGFAPAGALGIAWNGIDGGDLLGDDVAPPEDASVIDADSFDALRIRHGVPAMGRELTEKTIPAEAGPWFIAASVSFSKGCYTGQELVARIDSRGGNVPRLLRGLRFEGPAPAPGAEIRLAGDVVGSLTSATSGQSGDGLGLAYIKRGVELPADVEVADSDAAAGSGVSARLLVLPML